MNLAVWNGIGRVDIVENRFVGMKSRGVYEPPEAQFYMLLIVQLNLLPWTGRSCFYAIL